MSEFEGYNKFYRERKEGFGGGRPEQIVQDILKYKTDGSALEIGAGEGRHARFLAEKGFTVTAFDSSEAGIDSLKSKAAEQGVVLTAEVKDVTHLELEGNFDVMVNTYMLHHLPREQALELIRIMQDHTNVEGINAIAAFTKAGDIYGSTTDDRFLPEPDELKELYSDWEILEYSEAETNMISKKADGSSKKNFCARLLARKLSVEM